MADTLYSTHFNFPGQKKFHRGKVRDVYYIGDKILLAVVTDRISAFDVVLPRPIPHKGQVLNMIAAYFMDATKDIVPNWMLAVPDSNVTAGRVCVPYKVEMVVRGYICGHAWREYKKGKRSLCGVALPEGLKENDKFPQPIITPAIKSDAGHDTDVSREEIIKNKIIPEKDYLLMENYSRLLFQKGTEMAAEKDLILADTKYEFGNAEGKIYLIDEIHTPDSSRYFYKEGFDKRQLHNEPQRQLSKEFLRQWLIENNFTGEPGQSIPEMTDEFVDSVTKRYIELYEMLTGKKFIPADTYNITERIEKNVNEYLQAGIF